MSKLHVNKEDAVLVIIDIQERLMNDMAERDQVYKNTALLVETARQFNIPVILSEQYPRGLGPTVAEIKDHLEDYPCQYIEKTSFSVSDQLLEILPQGRKTLIITGTETHVCVYQTVRNMVEAGYNVHVAKDAVCSRFEINYSNGLDLMHDAGAVISNTETIVFDLLKISGTPEFKAISPLLK
jgi:nicotinamidase-related amidase